MELSNVWQREVKPKLRKASLGTLIELHRQLSQEGPFQLYWDTAYERGFEPIGAQTREILDLVHGPLTGPYQDALKEVR